MSQTEGQPPEEQQPKPTRSRAVRIFRGTVRWTFRAFLAGLTLVLLLVAALQLPQVQTWLAQYATDRLSEEIGYPIRVRGVYLNWYNRLELTGLTIEDTQGNGMIEAESVEADFSLTHLFEHRDLLIDGVRLNRPQVRLFGERGRLNIDHFVDAVKAYASLTDTAWVPPPDYVPPPKKPGIGFKVESIEVAEGEFVFDQPEAEHSPAGQFDPNHFSFSGIYGYVHKFDLHADTVKVGVRNLRAAENSSGTIIRELTTDFRFCNREMAFERLTLRAGETQLKRFLSFGYSRPGNLSYFFDSVVLKADLQESTIAFGDLAPFLPFLEQYEDTVRLEGKVNGTLRHLRLDSARIGFGRNSLVAGNMKLDGLPDVEALRMDFRLKDSRLLPSDVNLYAGEAAKPWTTPLGLLRFEADFAGTYKKFDLKGNFRSTTGRLKTEFSFDLDSQAYAAKLSAKDFHLGEYLKIEDYVQTLNADSLFIRGRGFSPDSMTLLAGGHIDGLEAYEHEYVNIVPYLDLNSGKAYFGIAIAEPSIDLSLEGEYDLRTTALKCFSNVEHIYLHELKLSEDSVKIATAFNLQLDRTDAETLGGELNLKRTDVTLGGKSGSLAYADLKTNLDSSGYRSLKLDSDVLEFKAGGAFGFGRLATDAMSLLTEFNKEYLEGDSATTDYYSQKNAEPDTVAPYRIDFEAELADMSGLLALLDSSVYISPETELEGYLSADSVIETALTARARMVRYGDSYFFRADTLLASLRKHRDKPGFRSRFSLRSPQQRVAGFEMRDFSIDFIGLDEDLYLDLFVMHRDSTDYLWLQSGLQLSDSLISIGLAGSEFQLLNQRWRSVGKGDIHLGDSLFVFDDLGFEHEDKKLYLDGRLGKSSDSELQVTVEEFDLNTLSEVAGVELGGRANVHASLRDLYGKLKVVGEARLDSIRADKLDMGSLFLATEWDSKQNKLAASASLSRQGNTMMIFTGGYRPDREEDNLRGSLILTDAPLDMAGPFLQGFVSDMGGKLIGNLDLRGELSAPRLEGSVSMLESQFRIDYLNTLYKVPFGKIVFQEGYIGTDRGIALNLADPYGNYAQLTGGIRHKRFTDFQLDIRGKMERFLMLNTTRKENDLYYGTAYASGRLQMSGPFSDILLDVAARTEKGTKFYLPLDSSGEVSESAFVKFVKNESLVRIDSFNQTVDGDFFTTEEVELSNFRMNFNFEITEEAYAEIIFDEQTRDILSANGRGTLRMNVDTQGELRMFGDIELTQGTYNFTLANFINKKFGILPNSSISWAGDPYKAQMDVTASYEQRVSLAPIISADSAALASPELSRRYPVKVLLGLKGELTAPEFLFDIEINDYPNTVVANGTPVSIESSVAAFNTRLQNDDQELNRQVFSLIVLKKLSPESNFTGIGNSAGSNVSELLTNQLSYFISQVDDNLEVNLELGGFEREDISAFQLRVSYSFLDGRLRVTREGDFTNQQNQADAASIVGDWTVEYMLTQDGKLRVKMYHKQNDDLANAGLQNGINTTSGLSVLYTTSFDGFIEALEGRKARERRRLKEEERLRQNDEAYREED